MSNLTSPEEVARLVKLYSLNIIPLRVILASFTWVLYDYFETLPDEVRYIWSQRPGFAKYSYLFMRYYTILLLVFDVVQIHSFAIPGVPSNTACVAIDPVVRIAGGISLWTIEIIMQARIYALSGCSKRVATFNGVMFVLSIIAFVAVMVPNTIKRGELIATAVRLPLPGCPSINGGTGWALWLPATGMEIILFGFVLYRGIQSISVKLALKERVTLHEILIGDHMLYFLGITVLLILNNLMAAGALKLIPWFSYGPFHGAMGIMTTRMLMHLRKMAVHTEVFNETPFSVILDDDDEDPRQSPSIPTFKVTAVLTRSLGSGASSLASVLSRPAGRVEDIERDSGVAT